MPRSKQGEVRRQGTVQMCSFAVKMHRDAAHALTENKKIVISAAVLAFLRLSRDEQIKACEEARRQHVVAGA